MTQSQRVSLFYPYKSVGIALLYTVLLGPVGLLYASFWGGCVMILLGMVVINSQLFLPILLLWLGCCIWAVRAVETSNRKLLVLSLEKN